MKQNVLPEETIRYEAAYLSKAFAKNNVPNVLCKLRRFNIFG